MATILIPSSFVPPTSFVLPPTSFILPPTSFASTSLLKSPPLTQPYPRLASLALASLAPPPPFNQTVGLDPFLHPPSFIKELNETLDSATPSGTISFPPDNLVDKIWESQPSLPDSQFRVHPLDYAGADVATKLKAVRAKMKEEKVRRRGDDERNGGAQRPMHVACIQLRFRSMVEHSDLLRQGQGQCMLHVSNCDSLPSLLPSSLASLFPAIPPLITSFSR